MSKNKIPAYSETIGLWGNGNGSYISKRYRKSFCEKLGNDIRFCLVHNPQHHKDDNRPRFLLRLYNNESRKKDLEIAEIQILQQDGLLEAKEVICLDDAIEIARSLISDAKYGYSSDDLVVEAESFMKEKSFEAISIEDMELNK